MWRHVSGCGCHISKYEWPSWTHTERHSRNTSNVELESAWVVPNEIYSTGQFGGFGLTERSGVEMFKVHVNLNAVKSKQRRSRMAFRKWEKKISFYFATKRLSLHYEKNLSGVVREIITVFRRVRKISKSDYQLRHVRLSACNNSAFSGRILIKLDIWNAMCCIC
jgi:hypothetical protein